MARRVSKEVGFLFLVYTPRAKLAKLPAEP